MRLHHSLRQIIEREHEKASPTLGVFSPFSIQKLEHSRSSLLNTLLDMLDNVNTSLSAIHRAVFRLTQLSRKIYVAKIVRKRKAEARKQAELEASEHQQQDDLLQRLFSTGSIVGEHVNVHIVWHYHQTKLKIQQVNRFLRESFGLSLDEFKATLQTLVSPDALNMHTNQSKRPINNTQPFRLKGFMFETRDDLNYIFRHKNGAADPIHLELTPNGIRFYGDKGNVLSNALRQHLQTKATSKPFHLSPFYPRTRL